MEALATAGAQATGGLSRMRDKYNLEEGRLQCRCIVRKWKFCKGIKSLADGKVTPQLLKAREITEVTGVRSNPDTNPDSLPTVQTEDIQLETPFPIPEGNRITVKREWTLKLLC